MGIGRILRRRVADTAECLSVTGKRWPTLFVVGAARAGTSSLWAYLDQHPQIFMSRRKEPHFFTDHRPSIVTPVSDEQTYLNLFARARPGQILGEASPSYLTDPPAPAAIARVSPDARIVAILRDPVARAHSAYWHRRRYGKDQRSFLEAIQTQLAEPDLGPPGKGYLRGGLYAEAIRRYLETFGSERVLVLFLTELAADTRGELKRIFEFLGVDPTAAERMRLPVRNATSLPRNALVGRLYRSAGLRALGRRLVPDSLHATAENVLLMRGGTPPLDPEARRLMEAFYAPEPAALEQLLGRPVPWARPADSRV
jgi:Sulfotransferase domain